MAGSERGFPDDSPGNELGRVERTSSASPSSERARRTVGGGQVVSLAIAISRNPRVFKEV